MVILAGTSTIVSPALLHVLLPWVSGGEAPQIDAVGMLGALLAMQLLPLLLGLTVKHWRPQFANRLLIPTRRLGDSRDSRIGSGVIQDGKRRVFAMGQAVPVRTDYTAGEVRRFARRAKDGAQARRLLALAAVLDGASREEAAKIGGMDRQTLRDWVIRYNEQGPDGLINIPSPGAPPKLDDTQKAFLRRIVEEGPIPAIHGVVRWRACDLIMRLHDEFGLSVSDDTIYRALKDLGFSHVSARPKAYKQDADAMAAFKKTLPYAWRKSARHSRLARQ
jgi:transposase